MPDGIFERTVWCASETVCNAITQARDHATTTTQREATTRSNRNIQHAVINHNKQ
jgi:hypothetical protein